MKRCFSAEKAFEMIMQPEFPSELQDLSSETEVSELSEEESDMEFEVESDPSTSSDAPPDSEEDTEDPAQPASEWTSKNGQIWVPSNTETTHYVPAARGLVPGPTRYAITRIHNMESSFDLFFTAEIFDIIVNMTNLQGRRSVANWTDVDVTDVRAWWGPLEKTSPSFHPNSCR